MVTKKKPASRRTTTKIDLAKELAALGPEAPAPTMPVAVALQEAHDVAVAAKKARAKLDRLPFDHGLIARLPIYVDALRDAESAWRSTKAERAKKSKKQARAQAEALKRDMLAAGHYFLRDEPAACAELDAIAEGDGLADLIEDLHALARFVRAHRAALAAADLTGGPDRAASQAESLARDLAQAASEEATDDTAQAAMARRDRAYALVARAVEEIRAAARYAFRKDPTALKPFRSAYRTRDAKRAGKKAPVAPAAPVAGTTPV